MTKKIFNKLLQAWYDENARQLPWVRERNPYLVWLSEIILQQTRVEQGAKYYLLFKKKFPTVKKLAAASEDTVLKLWEGLGYYTRARNLHSAAQTILKSYKGKFPTSYEEIRKLKGVGDYTAAAIASFAFDLPHAVADANVMRILARVFGIHAAVDSSKAKKTFSQLAQKLLDEKNPAQHNQAMMDFGATVCKPVSPACEICPVKKHCYAFQHDVVEMFPVRSKKIKKRKRYFHYFIISSKNKLFIQKRTRNDTWKNMYEFPLIEAKKNLSWNELKKLSEFKNKFRENGFQPGKSSRLFVQQLTHQTISARFFIVDTYSFKPPEMQNWLAVERMQLKDFAFPGIIREYLQEVL